MAMTPKQRIDAALSFKEVDRVPSAVLDGGLWVAEKAGYSLDDFFSLPDAGAQIVYDTYRKMRSDIIFVGGGVFGYAKRALGATAKFDEIGKSGETGTLGSEPEDFARFDPTKIREIFENDYWIQRIVLQTKCLKKLVGDEYNIASIGGGPFSYAGGLIGVQNLMMAVYEYDEEELAPLYDLAVAMSVEFNNILVEAGADIVSFGDPVSSGALISQDMYEKYSLPLLKRAIAGIKGAKWKLVHMCGNTTPRLECLVGTGIDAFSLDEVDLATALNAAKGDYTICGNLSPFGVMSAMTKDEVKALGIERCRLAGKKGGFILMPGCDLPNATPIENVIALAEAAEEA